jgi:hypothetical protein
MFSPDDWVRATRGRDFQFVATDNEVQQWLEDFLPAEYAPYKLIGRIVERVEKKKYVRKWPVFEFAEFEQTVKTHRCHWFWIWSMLVSPEMTDVIELKEGDHEPPFGAYGLLSLDHASLHTSGKTLESHIGLVNKLANRFTGELITHESYEKVFRTLKRKIKQLLKYSTFHHGRDPVDKSGRRLVLGPHEDRNLVLATEGAFREAVAGKEYWCVPANLLKRE